MARLGGVLRRPLWPHNGTPGVGLPRHIGYPDLQLAIDIKRGVRYSTLRTKLSRLIYKLPRLTTEEPAVPSRINTRPPGRLSHILKICRLIRGTVWYHQDLQTEGTYHIVKICRLRDRLISSGSAGWGTVSDSPDLQAEGPSHIVRICMLRDRLMLSGSAVWGTVSHRQDL